MSRDAWRDLVNVDRLAAWMDDRKLEHGPIENPEALTGGTQNLLLRFRRGKRQFVVRRPPLHPRLDGTETMRREARILGALAGTSVPHPRLIASTDDKTILGAGFYLMEPVDGFTPTIVLPERYQRSVEFRKAMGLAMVDAISDLGAVDFEKAGLSDFGKLDGYLVRQAPRWRSQLDSYRSYSGWPGPSGIPGVDDVFSWLEANRPTTMNPGIIHGDFQLSNVMFRFDAPELAAIVDWELASLGDPLLDLGWLIATWPNDDGTGITPTIEVRPWNGFATTDELIARYAARSQRDISNLQWYVILACYKLGIVLEGTYARAHAGKASMETGQMLHNATVRAFERALSWLNRSQSSATQRPARQFEGQRA
jgi:aminoglycoside phosphotransferase (APT) family kinase protein